MVLWRDADHGGREDRVLHRSLFDEMAERVGTVVEWDTSHSPMLSRPDLVVDLLRDLDST